MRALSCPPRLLKELSVQDQETLTMLVNFAQAHLRTIRRRSGESYAGHGLEVALTLKENTDDASLLAVALLHDLLVHPEGEALLRRVPLKAYQKKLIQQMHPLRRLHIDANTEDLDRVISAFTQDARLLLLRMAHRLNDVRHLDRFPAALRRQIARETLHMYTSIAGRLGMHAWRYEMEDVCFRFLHPSIVESLEQKLERNRSVDTFCLTHAKRFLQRTLRAQGIPCDIKGRIKGLYSMYRKMIIKNRRFEELTDRLALRIIVPDAQDCYLALGIVHSSFHPIPGKLKDYIGAPKENGYRSIHTVVYPLPGVSEQPIEIQIRSRDMHAQCEYGAAQHGDYKNFIYALQSLPLRVNLFRNLESLRQESRSPEQFEKALRTYFHEQQIALFDAKNNLYHLKKPVRVLDFLAHVYGKRCLRVRAARVNGRERPLDTQLHDGDTVDASFGSTRSATRDWVHACQHRVTRALIREALHEEKAVEQERKSSALRA